MAQAVMFLLALQVAAAPISIGAADSVSVTQAQGVYTVAATFTVEQRPSAAMAVLTDYEHLARFMPGLRKSSVAARAGTHVTLDQEADAKFLTFSKYIFLRLDIDESPLALRFRDTSGRSFLQYEGSWRLSAENGRTVVTYALVAKPAFSVPEFLLSHLLKRDSGRMIAALQTEIDRR